MIKSLISLRGIFILFIFLHHAGIYSGGGTLAVAFFFVLSGFSLTLGYKDRVFLSEFSYKQYLTRRCVKFFPLHWITLLADIPLVLMTSFHWWLIPVFFINAALLQSLVPVKEVYFSFNAVSWFLADILFFALLFPFLLKSIYRRTVKQRITIAFLLMLFYCGIIVLLPSSFRHAILYISPFVRILDFILGIYLALFYLDIKNNETLIRINHYGSLFLIIIFGLIGLLIIESCLLGSLEFISPLYWPLLAILIICTAIPKNGIIPFMENKFLIILGEYSFTIFLFHRLVIRYTEKLLSFNNKYVQVLFCFVATIVLSILIERYILNPLTQCLTKRNQQSMTAHS